jgi:hypothetical protein
LRRLNKPRAARGAHTPYARALSGLAGANRSRERAARIALG